MMRPKKSARDLPPRMLRRKRTLVSGKVWEAYYYNGRDENGKRIEIPLGTDLIEAKRKWAELESRPAPAETRTMRVVFDRYEREITPTKARRSQKDDADNLKHLRLIFDTAPIDAITPQHIAQYRDNRKSKKKGQEGKPAPVRANREISLLSAIWNIAREWGYTAKENPCKGVRKNKERPRDFYADDAVWDAVYKQAPQELQDAMDIAYLTGQRPADVIKMRMSDIQDGALEVKQGKSNKKLRIMLNREDGTRTRLGQTLDKFASRKVRSIYLVATESGAPLSEWMRRTRFDTARAQAVKIAQEEGNLSLAERIKEFQFRDARPKAASEITDIDEASKLLGHTEKQITKTVYRRIGEKVQPTK